MDYEMLETIQPVLVNISEQTESRWQRCDYDLLRESTEYHVLAYMTAGEARLELNGSAFKLRKGMLMYVPPRSRMRITTNRANLLRFYSVLFHYGQLRWDGMNGVWHKPTHQPLPLLSVLQLGPLPRALDDYERMNHLWQEQKPGYLWYCRMEFMQLLHRILKWMLEDSQEGKRNAALVESVIAYLREHLNEPFDRSALAAKLALSPGYFSILFKRYSGSSPIEYVTKLRIDRAKHLLINSSMPISRIAEEVGYADPLYFTRMFTRKTGVSPKKFRNL